MSELLKKKEFKVQSNFFSSPSYFAFIWWWYWGTTGKIVVIHLNVVKLPQSAFLFAFHELNDGSQKSCLKVNSDNKEYACALL